MPLEHAPGYAYYLARHLGVGHLDHISYEARVEVLAICIDA